MKFCSYSWFGTFYRYTFQILVQGILKKLVDSFIQINSSWLRIRTYFRECSGTRAYIYWRTTWSSRWYLFFEILKRKAEELPSNQTEPTNCFCKDDFLPILNKSFWHILEPFFFTIADKTNMERTGAIAERIIQNGKTRRRNANKRKCLRKLRIMARSVMASNAQCPLI